MKKLFIATIIVVTSGVLLSAFIHSKDTHIQDTDQQIPHTPEEQRQLEETYLLQAVDPDLLPFAHIEIPSLDNIATGSTIEGTHLDLMLFPDQEKKNSGIRSEISIDYPYHEGDTIEYSWQFKIPADFENDYPSNRWWILADWHDQPDPTLGETWDAYDSSSTPIIFGYGFDNETDLLSLSTGSRNSPEGIVFRGLVPISREIWHDIRMVVTWSQEADGRVTVYFDNEPEPSFDVRGENMVNGYQHYMKVGQYRHPEIKATSKISLRNIQIKTITDNQ